MSRPQKNSQQQSINCYLPAILKENKSGWIIEYYCEHPQTLLLTRKKIKLQRIISRYKKVSDARRHIAEMINTINIKLAGGWNPFYEGEDARLYEKLTDVAQIFLKSRAKELRKNTMRSYDSFVKIFCEWVSHQFPEIYMSVFAHNHAIRYMDDLFAKPSVGASTYNNHLKIARAFFNWAKERCYTKQNPFEHIKPKPKPKKKRIIIPQETRQEITEHLTKTNPQFLLILQLVYASLIRPNEINQLQIKHLHLKQHYIQIPSEIAKNHKERYATINQPIIDLFQRINIARYPVDYYLFSSDLMPGKEPAGYKRYAKEWDKMRRNMKLPQEMQLYSLRDTGIFEMLKSGIDNLSVMQHADHSSLDITTIYANHVDPKLNELIYSRAPQF